MLARVWWKEWRSLAPIMAILVIAAGALQWFLLAYGGREVRNGILTPIALGFAVVYALVAGTASFAGERENRTMGFLDALPVGRGMLWRGKVSFCLASSFTLAILLRVISSIGWIFEAPPFAPVLKIDLYFAVLLAEATVWGLFWSSVSKNAITAGILAVLTTGGTSTISGWFNAVPGQVDEVFKEATGWSLAFRLGCLIGALGVSWLVVKEEFAVRLPTRRVGGTRGGNLLAMVRPNRTWLPSPAFWRVLWQTFREGRVTWLQTVGLGVVLPYIGVLVATWTNSSFGNNVGPLSLFLFVVALLIQGTSVFGLESAAGTRQFLDNQAVPAGTVWAAKVVIWGFGLFVISLIFLAWAITTVGIGWVMPADLTGPSLTFAAIADTLAVGLICGMMFARRITAVLIAFLVAFAVIVPQGVLVEQRMIPAWISLVIPLVLLGVSRLWAGDWLANRGGFRRWIKLAGLVVVPFGALLVAYVVGRAWGVPDVGPQFDPNPMTVAVSNLARQYGEAHQVIVGGFDDDNLKKTLNQGWSAANDENRRFWKENPRAIELARQAAGQPRTVEVGDNRPTVFSLNQPSTVSSDFYFIQPLLALDASERQSHGDSAGAWADILAQFQMSNQGANAASSLNEYDFAMTISQGATRQALAWAKAPNISVDDIRAAKASLEPVAAVPNPSNALRAESRRIERSLDDSAEKWADFLSPRSTADESFLPFNRIFTTWVVAPAWERERTRRIVRRIGAVAINNAEQLRSRRVGFVDDWTRITPSLRTPLAERIVVPLFQGNDWFDRELTNRRALKLFLALRAWQLTRDGKAPAKLEELVPTEIDKIPQDPYDPSFGPLLYFGFIASETPDPLESEASPARTPENLAQRIFQYWIFSKGSNGTLDVGFPERTTYSTIQQNNDDFVYILPANPPEPK